VKLVFIVMLFLGEVAVAQVNSSLSGRSAEDVIRLLDLKPLPEEGGYYRETFRALKVEAPARAFGIQSVMPRTASTAIYYLVTPESFSALHRVASDEVFHFYAGDPIEIIQIDSAGRISKTIMGNDIFVGHTPQVIVKKHVWQGLRILPGGSWALMGTTVAPGFEFEDFVIGPREQLIQAYPQHKDDIIRFTREPGEKAH